MSKIVDWEDERTKGTITSLADERLLKIDPTREGFFDKILDGLYTYAKKCEGLEKRRVIKFMGTVETVKASEIPAFWRPALDPSFEGEDDEIIFEKDMYPATGMGGAKSFNWWKEKVKEMPAVEGKKWQVGTFYQYNAFLVWLFNRLIEEKKWTAEKAIEAIVLNSKELGNYRDSEESYLCLELTGCRNVCGCCDLANTAKLLRRDENTCWYVGGNFDDYGYSAPLADGFYDTEEWMDEPNYWAVAWLVLE